MRWGDITRVGEVRNCYKILAGKPEGKRFLERPELYPCSLWGIRCTKQSAYWKQCS